MTQRANRSGLLIPFVIVGLALAGWTGWWFYLVRQIESGMDAAAVSLRAQGWQVDYSDPHTTGWPFRARVESDHVSIVAPSGHAVAAPVLVAEANAYNPDRWVMLAPDGLTLTRGAKGKVNVRGRVIRASASGLAQPYPDLALELAEPVFTALPGAEPFPLASARRIELYLRPHADEPAASVGSAVAPEGRAPVADADRVDMLFRLVEGRGRSGGAVDSLSDEGVLSLDMETTIERFRALRGANAAAMFGAWSAAGGAFTGLRGEATAGDSTATLSSQRLVVGADGRLNGTVALESEEPLSALSGLARSGQVSGPAAAGAAAATAVRGGMTGDFDIVVVFRDGRTYLGPFNLAPAPKLF